MMYCIMTYDIANPKRLRRILKTARQYLHWVQNSVFEGDMTELQLENLKIIVDEIIDKKEDTIFFYTLRTKEVMNKIISGIEKNEISFII